MDIITCVEVFVARNVGKIFSAILKPFTAIKKVSSNPFSMYKF